MSKELPVDPALQAAGIEDGLATLMGWYQQTTRLAATDRNVLGLPGAWAAVNKIANAVATMMTAADAFGPDGRTVIKLPSVLDDPYALLDSFTFWKMVTTTALCRGNFVGIKADFDPMGYPRQIIPVPPQNVNAHYEDGFVRYEIAGESYRPDEVVHVRVGVMMPGEIMAIGAIEAHRRGLTGMLDQQHMSNTVFREGGVPSGVLELDTPFPTALQVKAAKEGWIGMLDGRKTVAVTGTATKYTPIAWSAEDSQFIEAQQFSVAASALIFGIAPSLLDATIGGTGKTYGNRQADQLAAVTESYSPVMAPLEQAWSRLIPGRNFVRGNVEALLRSSTRERYELHELAQKIGLESVDETRDIEGKPALQQAPEPAPVEAPEQQEEAA